MKIFGCLLTAFLCLYVGTARAVTVTLLNSNQQGGSSTPGNTIAFAPNVQSGSGDTIVVVVTVQNTSYPSDITITDNAGNTYTEATASASNNCTIPNPFGGNSYNLVFYASDAFIITVGGTITISSTSSLLLTAAAFDIAGTLLISPLDTATRACATGSSTSPSVTSGTPGASGELFVSGMIINSSATVTTITEASGFTQIFTPFDWFISGSHITPTLDDAYKVNAGSATVTYNPTLSPSRVWATNIVSFKLIAVAASSHQVPTLGAGHM